MFRSLLAILGMGTAACVLSALSVCANPYTPASQFPVEDGNSMMVAASKNNRQVINAAQNDPVQVANTPSMVSPKQMETLLRPGDTMTSVGNLVQKSNPTTRGFLEIEVSHSQHSFKLVEHMGSKQEILYECKIGLGSSEFPTPVGVYFVTHIYDDDPWWIPPKDRAWAAGDSPSRKVYGGTMAPLLKKKPVRQKKQPPQEGDDLIAGPMELDDYGYRFHGTNAPRSIGRNQSHGCVRMISADAKKVAGIIKDKVGIMDRRESENGTFAVLNAPVRLNLIK